MNHLNCLPFFFFIGCPDVDGGGGGDVSDCYVKLFSRGEFLFSNHSFTHLPPVASKAGIGSHYAFQSAGGSPVLAVNFLRSL